MDEDTSSYRDAANLKIIIHTKIDDLLWWVNDLLSKELIVAGVVREETPIHLGDKKSYKRDTDENSVLMDEYMQIGDTHNISKYIILMNKTQ